MRMTLILACLFCSILTWAEDQPDTSLNSAFSTTQELTEQQSNDARNFVHQGVLQNRIDEKCKDNINCDSSKIDQAGSVFGGDFFSIIEQNIGRLYSGLVGGMGMLGGGGAGKVKVVDKQNDRLKEFRSNQTKQPTGTEQKDSMSKIRKDEHESKNDYCIYAALGYEMISTYIHQSLQKNIEKKLQDDKSDEQVKALTALMMEHQNRQKTSKYQGSIYAATSACYITRWLSSGGRVVMDPAYIAKMSASGAISALYFVKAKKHGEAAKFVEEVIKTVPTAGYCNPYSQTTCFCRENTSKTAYPDLYQQICELKKDVAEVYPAQIPCGVMKDGKMVVDQECKCKLTNSCFKASVSISSPEVKFGTNLMNETNKAFDLLNNGNLNAGELDNYAARMAATARKLASKAKIPDVPLTPEQKKIADSLKDLNLPAGVAGMIAKSPQVNAPGLNMGRVNSPAISKLPKSVQDKLKDLDGPKFKSGSAIQNVAETEEIFDLPKLGEEAASEDGVEVMEFAEAAVSKADVSNSPETPIFDIISNRYKRSGWTKLEPSDQK